MKILKKPLILVFLSVFILQGCNDDDTPTLPEEVTLSQTITINTPGLYPGKFDFNPRNNHFVVGSLLRSEVGLVTPETGAYATFINDPNFAMVTGIRVDDANNRILIASADFGFSDQSVGLGQVGYFGVYDIVTGAKIAGVNLKDLSTANAVFPNDIAVDNNGDIYITDSYNPFIYKVDGSSYTASIWLDGGDDFANETSGAAGGLAMNGLEYTNGFLIAAKTDSGELFKIPVNNPTAFTLIGGGVYPGMDGIKLDANGHLLMAETGLGGVEGARVLRTNDNWDSASQVLLYEISPGGEFPTSVTIAHDGNAYFITAKLGDLVTGNANLVDSFFNIYRIPSN
jgi:sugar lactone lactonase YvrE